MNGILKKSAFVALLSFAALLLAFCVMVAKFNSELGRNEDKLIKTEEISSSNGRTFKIEYRSGGFLDPSDRYAWIYAIESEEEYLIGKFQILVQEPSFKEIYVSGDVECYMFFDEVAVSWHYGSHRVAYEFYDDMDIRRLMPFYSLPPTAKILADSEYTPSQIRDVCRRYLAWQAGSPKTVVNDWLILNRPPTRGTGGREVEIPDGADARKWATAGGGRRIAGSPGAVEYGTDGAMFDENGRYWVAVGPAVMNPGRDPSAKISREEMRYGTEMDIVVRDGEGNAYYVYATVGGAKDHTYPNGVYGTKVSFSDPAVGAEETPSCSVVEFMGASSVRDLRGYEIVKLIVYD